METVLVPVVPAQLLHSLLIVMPGENTSQPLAVEEDSGKSAKYLKK